jgi:hypothetical protein
VNARFADARFADELVSEFQIARGGLAEAIERWRYIFECEELREQERERHDAALAEFDKALLTTEHLAWELESPLARALAGVRSDDEVVVRHKEHKLKELRYVLARLRAVAADIPRRRAGVGEHDRENKALRALVKVVVDYWELDLRREFKQNHKAWAPGRDGKLEPTGKPVSVLFAFRVVEHFAPGAGITLRTILREFPTRRRWRRHYQVTENSR